MFELDRSMCARCGAWVPRVELVSGRHECDAELEVALQTRIARIELDRGLEAAVQIWEHDPRLVNRLAFARYLRERASAEDARRAA